MTIIANRDVSMAAVLPEIERILHHMAVNARLRVIAEITPPIAIAESESADASQHADHRGQRDGLTRHSRSRGRRRLLAEDSREDSV